MPARPRERRLRKHTHSHLTQPMRHDGRALGLRFGRMAGRRRRRRPRDSRASGARPGAHGPTELRSSGPGRATWPVWADSHGVAAAGPCRRPTVSAGQGAFVAASLRIRFSKVTPSELDMGHAHTVGSSRLLYFSPVRFEAYAPYLRTHMAAETGSRSQRVQRRRRRRRPSEAETW